MPRTASATHDSAGHSGRLRLFDVVRGFSVVSMVCFHGCYDLVYLFGVSVPWFEDPWRALWRASIAWTFLLVSGWMCSFSHNNLARAGRYLAVAALIYGVTALAAVDDPISFGIIFCIGATTLVDALLAKAGVAPRKPLWALGLLALFLVCLPLPSGFVGLGSWRVALPRALYDSEWLAWAGFPGPLFVSGDYYPLLPFGLMYGVGAVLGRWCRAHGYPSWVWKVRCAPLEWVGRHSLPVYVIHQPVLLALGYLLL